MFSRDRSLLIATGSWSILATVLNLIAVCYPPEKISFVMGLTGFVFCLCGHLSFIWAAIAQGAKYKLKCWPLWLTFLHPIVGMACFSYLNWYAISTDE